ncbi:type II secretion system protein N [Amaricoccus sp.]|uniref:type II secretion system protein N n=1 Tax=Amaricoccus sp. TaxID=1872485 RepID=UPI001B6F3075|nr:type II secretion system protein N [Amaricoccus sp.]MBP7242740.1 hypothetical protein [Amaricoccus sp.]
MNRTGTGRPEFRLRFGYPNLVVEEDGAAPRAVELDAADAVETLRAVGAEIRSRGGRLTAVLPEGEVWRGRARDREAAARVAGRALGASARDLTLRMGPKGADGLRPVAAVPKATLRDARGFLGRAGVRPDRLTGAGVFEGFPAPPDFGGSLAELAGGRAAAASGLAATLALLAWLGPWAPAETPLPVAALAPVAETPQTEVAATLEATLEATPVEAMTAPATAAPALAAPVRAARLYAPPPPRRPVDLAERPAERTYVLAPTGTPYGPAVIATRGMPTDLPATSLPRSRTPLDNVAPPMARPAAPAATPAATPIAAPAAPDGPMPRPRTAAAAVAPPVRTAALVENGPVPRPASARPGTVASLVAALDSAIATPAEAATPEDAFAAAASVTPRARPGALVAVLPARPKAPEPEGVQVASLAPLAETPGLASVLAPEPRRIPAPTATPTAARARPAPVRASVAPAAKPVLRAQPVARTEPVIRAQPARVQTAALQPSPQPARIPATKFTQPSAPKAQAATPKTVRAAAPAPQPARTQTVRVEPAAPAKATAKRTVRAEPQRQPARAKQVQRREEASVSRSQLALVGVFGGSGGKHALIQLPNGETERVKPGDTIRGVQVVAIASDSVQVRSRGRDSVLRLPD